MRRVVPEPGQHLDRHTLWTPNMTQRFEIIQEVGSGGMATVVEARDTVLDRVVAIKRLHRHIAAEPAAAERFKREALSGAALGHPGIVTVFDAGEDDDGPFIVMELVRGETLAGVLKREGRLPPSRAAAIAARVAEALDHAHRQGVLHRDVKPGNVLLTEGDAPKLADFGIAASLDAHTGFTDTGTVLGTVAYLAPERVAGEPATPASDLYALGIVLYEMLTGRLPFDADSPAAMAVAHQTEAPIPASAVVAVPADLEGIVLRALAKEPSRRFASAREFGDALQGWLDGVAATIPLAVQPDAMPTAPLPAAIPASRSPLTQRPNQPAAATRVPRPPRRHRPTSLLAVGAIVAIAALAIAVLPSVPGASDDPEAKAIVEDRPEAKPGDDGQEALAIFETTTTEITVEELFADLERLLLEGLDAGMLDRRAFDELRKRADKALEEWLDGDLEDTAKELDEFDDKAIEEFARGRIATLSYLDELFELTELIREVGELPEVEDGRWIPPGRRR